MLNIIFYKQIIFVSFLRKYASLILCLGADKFRISSGSLSLINMDHLTAKLALKHDLTAGQSRLFFLL